MIPNAPDAAAAILAYHARTKHHLDRYAAGPATLDWDAQPDPFRHWRDTPVIALPRDAARLETPWSELNSTRPPAPADLASLGRLLQLACAITAWKQYGDSRWALRAHPSSGNLHPTETWVIARGLPDLADGLYHYQARSHSLELRASEPGESGGGPGLWLGFSSIAWREAWKYGERAFRYCQLDLGHVLAAVSHAAALLGWAPRAVPLEWAALSTMLGLDRSEDYAGVEAEEADLLLALTGEAMPPTHWQRWHGRPNRLDPQPMYHWPVIDEAASASRGATPELPALPAAGAPAILPESIATPAAAILLKRRSAQAFDPTASLPSNGLRSLLAALLPGGSPVWRLWTAPARVHPLLFAHRIEGLAPGLYALPRSESGLIGMGEAMRPEFEWRPADPTLPLYRLVAARSERTARTLCCHQDIAAHAAFSLAFVAEFAAPIRQNPAAWRHLHWEAGMLGHALTLAAEAMGWRGTGIGCFFDDADHELLGLTDDRFQVLYHFAVGRPLDDPRITTLPAYAD